MLADRKAATLGLVLIIDFLASGLQAQTAQLVKDIGTAPRQSFSAAPQVADGVGTAAGLLFFQGCGEREGCELWKSDGTTSGTGLVKDIIPGSPGSFPTGFADVNGIVFFSGSDLAHGFELWKSDGTPGGTVLVKDIAPGSASSTPHNLVNVNGTLFFAANDQGYSTDETTTSELWKSDGTVTGTVRVATFRPGVGSFGAFTSMNGVLFFSANDGVTGDELWRSDGTAAGTVLVRDIYPGPTPSYAWEFTNVGGTLFFTAESPGMGRELWKSNGTAAGTVIVKDIVPGEAASFPTGLTGMNGVVFFVTYELGVAHLWKSDGTADGTMLLKDLYLDIGAGMKAANGLLYFAVWNGINDVGLWRTDGTPGGTVRVKGVGDPGDFTDVNGTLFFTGYDSSSGRELWKSDGTPAGTVLVKDIWPGSSTSVPTSIPPSIRILTSANGAAYFFANDGVNGTTLWKSDGSATGTLSLTEQAPHSSIPYGGLDVNGTLFFVADTPDAGRELWSSDGTPAGTKLVLDVWPGATGSEPRGLTNLNGTLFFFAMPPYRSAPDLWKTDGTAQGTVVVKASSEPKFVVTGDGAPVVRNGALYFTTYEGLWRSDGTTAGTLPISTEIGNMPVPAQPGAIVGNALFFSAAPPRSSEIPLSLWRTDGTATGTAPVASSAEFLNPERLTNLNGTLLFFALSPTRGRELWRSDGTAAGTVLVKDIWPGVNSSEFLVPTYLRPPAPLATANGAIFFAANDGVSGYELWKTDGTSDGTVLVKDIQPGPASSRRDDSPLVVVDGIVYFTADDGVNGMELWRSDGTTSGTFMLRDIHPGGASNPHSLRGVGDTLYFGAYDPIAGDELWRSDGTSIGTHLVQDTAPGILGGIGMITSAGNQLFFTAYDDTIGSELWKVDSPELAFASIDDASVGEGHAGPTLLGFTVTLSPASSQTVTIGYQTEDLTATAGSDYVARSGTITFAPGQTTRTILVSVTGDTTVEPNETLRVRLSAPTGALLAKDSGIGTITNDDPATAPAVIDVYRLFASNLTGEHLFTTSLAEYNALGATYNPGTKTGWVPEGVAFRMWSSAGPTPMSFGKPFYRLYNMNLHQHHWTADAIEAAALSALPQWSYEGIVGYIQASPTPDEGTALFRLWNGGALHLWTIYANEKNVLSTQLGWTYEGIVGTVLP